MCTGGVQRPPHLEMELGFPNFWEHLILDVNLGCLDMIPKIYMSTVAPIREIWYCIEKFSFHMRRLQVW